MCVPDTGWCYRFDLTTGALPSDVSFRVLCGEDCGVANVGQVDSVTDELYISCSQFISFLQVKIQLSGTNTTGIRLYGGGNKGDNSDRILFLDEGGVFSTWNNPDGFYNTGFWEVAWDRDMDFVIAYIQTGALGDGSGLGNSWFTAIELFSDEGSNPFGSDNCDP